MSRTSSALLRLLASSPVGELLVDGDSNVNLAVPEGAERDEGIVAALEAVILEDMLEHVHPHQSLWT